MIHSKTIKQIILAVGLFVVSPTVLIYADIIEVPGKAKSIERALLDSRDGDTVLVDDGVYTGRYVVPTRICLKARHAHKAELNGGGRGTVVTLTNGSSINGFIIANGTIGVFSNGTAASIRECRIATNHQAGIICVRNLPQCVDNIIAFNGGSGIQTWDVRAQNAAISHNTIAYNGNHGISIGGSASFVIENNVIAFNERFSIKIKQAKSKDLVSVMNNNMFGNLLMPEKAPIGNFSYDPAFVSPRNGFDFREGPNVCCQHKGSDNETLGAHRVAE